MAQICFDWFGKSKTYKTGIKEIDAWNEAVDAAKEEKRRRKREACQIERTACVERNKMLKEIKKPVNRQTKGRGL